MIYVCSNVETLVDGTYLQDHPEMFAIEGIWNLVRERCHEDYDYDSHYSHWHGGKFDQFFNRCGFVAIPTTASKEQEKFAWALNDAIKREVENQAHEEFKDKCLHWATELEAENVELDWFKAQVAPALVNCPETYETVQEMVAELRRMAA